MRQYGSNYSLIAVSLILMANSDSNAAAPLFHLKNKGAESIQINVIQRGKSITGLKTIRKNDDFSIQTIDLTQPITLELFFCPSKDWCKTNLQEKLVAGFEPNKPIYIKFTGAGLAIQKGVLGISTQGYRLKDAAQITSQDFYVGYLNGSKKEYKKTTKPSTSITHTKKTGVEKLTKTKEVSVSKKTTSIPYTPMMPSDIVTATTQPPETALVAQSGKQRAGTTMHTVPANGFQQTARKAIMAQAAPMPENNPHEPVAGQVLLAQKPSRIPPVAPAPKNQTQADIPVVAKQGLHEQDTSVERKAHPEEKIAQPDDTERAWLEFAEANLLRKKLKQGAQSPFVARKVLGLDVNASMQDVEKRAKNLIASYTSRSYKGDIQLVPTIETIITNAKTVLQNSIFPPLAHATVSQSKYALQKLLYEAPTGFEEFAASLYQELLDTTIYSRGWLQSTQQKILKAKLPKQWKQLLLTNIQRELAGFK